MMNTRSTEAAESVRPKESSLWPWLVAQLAVASVLCWLNRDVLNHDALAYLRIAEYYAAGDTERMISGYWGPLLSWLLAVGLKLGLAQMLCARVVMMLSAGVFLVGGSRLLEAFKLAGVARRLGLALFAITSATWSAQNISPDLLMSGLALWALAIFLKSGRARFLPGPDQTATNERARGCWKEPAFAGLLWGLAYLAKPIALPWAVLILGAAVGGNYWHGKLDWRRPMAVGLALLAVTGPWITVLSFKYGHFTISTSGPIAHTLAGPADVDRYHPTFVTLHRPEAGRITSWEDPTNLGYRPWSPFASEGYLRHQLEVVAANVFKVLFILTTLVPVWPWAVWRWVRVRDHRVAIGLALVPIALLALIYLPVYLTANEQRYFYVAVPLLWCALAVAVPRQIRLFFLLTLLVTIGSMVRFSYPPRVANRDAHALAGWLQREGKFGPVAGSGLQRGGRTGLFLAWHLRQPWFGDDPAADAATLARCGARLLILRSDDPRLVDLSRLEGGRVITLPTGLADQVVVIELAGPSQ